MRCLQIQFEILAFAIIWGRAGHSFYNTEECHFEPIARLNITFFIPCFQKNSNSYLFYRFYLEKTYKNRRKPVAKQKT